MSIKQLQVKQKQNKTSSYCKYKTPQTYRMKKDEKKVRYYREKKKLNLKKKKKREKII